MDQLLETIRAATVPDASDDAKAAGANACRMLLAALETTQGEPMPSPVPVVQSTTPDIGAIVAGLKGVPVDQLLDLAIAKLRTMVPADQAPAVRRLTIPLVPLPKR